MAVDDEDCEMCQNCKRDIPLNNYRMHTLHCARNVVLCPECDEPVPKSAVEEHRREEHMPKVCEHCAQEVVKPETMADHKASSCPERVVLCQFCQLDRLARELPEHEQYCGSRTEQCKECKDFVMLKDWEKHEKMTLYHELAKKPCSKVFGYEPLKPSSSSSAFTPILPSWLDKSPTAISSSSSFGRLGGASDITSPSFSSSSTSKFQPISSWSRLSNLDTPTTTTSSSRSSNDLLLSGIARKTSLPTFLPSTDPSSSYRSRHPLLPRCPDPTPIPSRSQTYTRFTIDDEDEEDSSNKSDQSPPDLEPILAGRPAKAVTADYSRLPPYKRRQQSSSSFLSKKYPSLEDPEPRMAQKVDDTPKMDAPDPGPYFGARPRNRNVLGGSSKYGDPNNVLVQEPLSRTKEKRGVVVDEEVVNDDIDGETTIPCEFCEEPIPILRLIKHQTDCTRNMDSIYFNARVPLNSNEDDLRKKKTWPAVVTKAMTNNNNNNDADDDDDDEEDTKSCSSPPNLISFDDDNSSSSLLTPLLLPPPLPPKTRTMSDLGARPKNTSPLVTPLVTVTNNLLPGLDNDDDEIDVSDLLIPPPREKKKSSSSSIVGKYLGEKAAPPVSPRRPLLFLGDDDDIVMKLDRREENNSSKGVSLIDKYCHNGARRKHSAPPSSSPSSSNSDDPLGSNRGGPNKDFLPQERKSPNKSSFGSKEESRKGHVAQRLPEKRSHLAQQQQEPKNTHDPFPAKQEMCQVAPHPLAHKQSQETTKEHMEESHSMPNLSDRNHHHMAHSKRNGHSTTHHFDPNLNHLEKSSYPLTWTEKSSQVAGKADQLSSQLFMPQRRHPLSSSSSVPSSGSIVKKENPEQDLAEREKLRKMLSDLRKDPFDEDLENNDGNFFPCEFCGDPYPVEFIMRHQLSCDLNPSPVSSGQGFDYATIRNRAEKNLELAKSASNIKL